jgi:DNA-binding HxlR family transcriptional regulator
VRELIFGNYRFDQIARNTGAPRDRLTVRLGELREAGVIERVQYNEHPPRYEYRLTAAGRDLSPVITALRNWGDKWAVDEPPVVFRHSCGHELDPVPVCRECRGELGMRTLTPEINSPGWDLSGPVADVPEG